MVSSSTALRFLAGAGLLAAQWRPGWWYAQSERVFHAQVVADHAMLALADPGTEQAIVSQVRVAQTGLRLWVWHTAVGFPADPNQEDSAFAGISGVRVVECVQGRAPSRDAAKSQAAIHIGVKVGPYLPNPTATE